LTEPEAVRLASVTDQMVYARAVDSARDRADADAYFRAFERWDLDAAAALIAEDAVEGRPQSGERFVGRENILGMLRSLPSEPRITWRSIRGGPRVWVAEGVVEYGDGPVHLIGIAELEDGRMVRADYYFSDPFEAPEYRAPFTG
jgi:hypothetical protein